jgi:uncharacterized protein with PhoU and TrkA domain
MNKEGITIMARDGAAEEVAKLATELGSMSIQTSLKAMDAILRTAGREAGTLAGVINARAIAHHVLRASEEISRTVALGGTSGAGVSAKQRVKIF